VAGRRLLTKATSALRKPQISEAGGPTHESFISETFFFFFF
jgi:hypothetical protein